MGNQYNQDPYNQNQGYPNQDYQNQDYQNQGYPNQGYQNQGYQNQGYPNQGYYQNQGYPNQGYQNQGYQGQDYSNQEYQAPPSSHMVMAVLVTLFCCLPFGIPAIINASKVEGLWHAGNRLAALDASRKAKKWIIVSLILGILSIALSVAYWMFVSYAAVEYEMAARESMYNSSYYGYY